jgi:hypothetical protein
MLIADKRYYLTADGRAVEEGHPDAATLLFGKGTEITEATAAAYGLSNFATHEQESRESATMRQLDAAKARGAVEEVRALEARLPADKAADDVDPNHDRRLTGGPAEARADQGRRAAAQPVTAPLGPGGTAPRLTADDPPGVTVDNPSGVSTDDDAKAKAAAANKARSAPAENKDATPPASGA